MDNLLLFNNHSCNNSELFQLTLPNHVSYCERHNYSMLNDNGAYSPYIKTDMICDLLHMYKFVVTIGSDCVFTRPDTTIESFIPDDKPMAICEEGSRFPSICNGEILIMRSCSEMFNLLDYFSELQKQYPNRLGFQGVGDVLFEKKLDHWDRVHLIPAGELMCYVPVDRDYYYYEAHIWKRGDFLAHALRGNMYSRIERCKKVLEQIK